MDIKKIRRANLQALMAEHFPGRGSQTRMADALGKSQNYISRCLADPDSPGAKGIGEDLAREIEKEFKLPLHSLDRPGMKPQGNSVEPGPSVKGRLPLISWVQAGAWSEIVDPYYPGDAEDWLPCPANHSDTAFVLRVRGESMFNPHGPKSFREDDLIFVDPEREPGNGSLVIAKLVDSQQATFKQLVIEGDERYLKALNPAWPEPMIKINGNCHIVGVVFFKGEQL